MGKSLSEINNNLKKENVIPTADQATPLFPGRKIATSGNGHAKEPAAPAAKTLDDINADLIGANKKKSGQSGESSPESESTEDSTTVPSSSTGQTKPAGPAHLVDNTRKPTGGIPFLTDFNKQFSSEFDGFANIAGKDVDLNKVTTLPGPLSSEIKNLHRRYVIDRVKNKEINDEDALAIGNSIGADPNEVKQSINSPTTYRLNRAKRTIEGDIVKTVKARPEDLNKLRQAVLDGDGDSLSGYYQKRSSELTRQIEDTQREMSKFEQPVSAMSEIGGSDTGGVTNTVEYNKLKQKLDYLKGSYRDLNDATGTMLAYQLSAKADKPDAFKQVHAFDINKAKELGARVKEVFNPIGSQEDKKRLAAGYNLSQDVEYENAKIGMEARIFAIANKLEDAKERLRAAPADKTTVDNFNGVVSEYNDALGEYPKISDKFPEVRRKELTQGLIDLYYKKVQAQRATRSAQDAINPINKVGWGTVRNLIGYVLNETPSEEDIQELSKQTGLSVAEINKLNDKKGFWDWNFGKRENIRTNGLLSSVAAGFYGGARNFEKFATRIAGSGTPIDRTVRNEAVTRAIEDVRRTPTEEQLYQPELKVDLNRYDKDGNINPSFLRNRLNEDAGKFNLNPSSFVHTVGDTYGQLALFAGAGRIAGLGIEKVAQGLITSAGMDAITTGAEAGLSASDIAAMTRTAHRFGELAGTMASGFALSYDDYYTQAGQYTQDEGKRNLSASTNSAIEGLTELIFPDVDIAKAMRGNKNLFPIFDKLLKKNGGVVSSGLVKEYAGAIAKGAMIANVEGLEEALNVAGTALSDAVILHKDVDVSQIAEQAKQAYVTTMVGMIPSAVGATIGSAARIKKEGLFEAGNEPTKYIDHINDLVLKGKLDQADADKRIQTINTMADIVKGIPQTDPNGHPYSVDQKVEIAAQEFRIRNNKKIKDGAAPVGANAIKAAADKDTEEAKKIQEAIITNTPLYKIDGKEATDEEMIKAIESADVHKKAISILNDSDMVDLLNKRQEARKGLTARELDISTNGIETISSPKKIQADETKTEEQKATTEAPQQANAGGEQTSNNEETVRAAEAPTEDITTEDLPAAVREKLKPAETPKTEQTASIPVMITKKMEADLAGLGYDQDAINKLTPQQANDIIKDRTTFSSLNNNKTQNNAIQEQSPTEGVLRDERIRQEGELPGVQQGDQSEDVAQQGQEENQQQEEIKAIPHLPSINGNFPNENGVFGREHPDARSLVLKGSKNRSPDAEIRTVQLENGKWIGSHDVQAGKDSEGRLMPLSAGSTQYATEQEAIEAQAGMMRDWIKGKVNEKRVNSWIDSILSPFITDTPSAKQKVSAPIQKAVDALSKSNLSGIERDMLKSNPEGMVGYIAEQATGIMGRDSGNLEMGTPRYTETVANYGQEAVDAAIDALPQDVKDFIESERTKAGEENPATMEPLTQEEVDELNKELAGEGISVEDIVNHETANLKPIIDESTNIPNPQGISEETHDEAGNNTEIQEALSQPKDVTGADLGKDPAGERVEDPASASPDSALSTEERLKKEISDKEDVFFRKLKAARSRLNALGPIDPEAIAAGVDLLTSYAKLGIYKLSVVVKRLIDKYGHDALDMEDLLAIRGVYAYYRDNSSKEERSKMENIDEVDEFFINELPELRAGKKVSNEPPKEDAPSLTPERELIQSLGTVREFVDFVGNAIDNNRKLNIIDLRKEAQRIGLQYNGDTHLQELAELAIVEKAREVALSSDMEDEKMEQIVKIYDNQPALHQRSSERVEKQQYSTPIPISYVAGMYVQKIQPESVHEPSAGNGLLTVAFDPEIVQVNEIDNVRLSNLAQQGFAQITNQDATKPFNIAPVDGVLTNPPFGGAPMKTYDGYKISGLDEQMAINALNTMKNNGRAAIIIGGHSKYADNGSLSTQKVFFNYLYNHYNVADVINIDGSLYAKQGTSFPVRLILIDGRKAKPNGAAPLKNDMDVTPVKSFADLFERVNNLESLQTEEDETETDIQSSSDAKSGSGDTVHGGDTGTGQAANAGTNTGTPSVQNSGTNTGSNAGERASTGTNTGNIGDRPSGRNESTGTNAGNNEQRPISSVETNVPESVEQPIGGITDAAGSEGTVPANQPVSVDRKFGADDLKKEKVPYVPASTGKNFDLVIPTQMASEAQRVLSEINVQHGGVDNFVKERLKYPSVAELHKALGAEQIDAVAIAISNIEKGQGMIVGDMTGTGKGRIAASIVRYAVNQGLKPIFLTEKPNLFSDLYRDLVATGNGNLVPFIVNDKGAKNDPTIYDENGVAVHKTLAPAKKKNVFSSGELPAGTHFTVATYSQFTSSKPSTKKAFLAQIAPGNILIMDESHNVSGDSNSGEYFQNILSSVKGVTFLSATFAKRPDNMPVYALKTAISEANMTSEELVNAISRGGVALQEVVSAQLVESGQMLRRERNFEGVTTQFDMLENLKDEHRRTADQVTSIMRDIVTFEKHYINPVIQAMDDELAGEGSSADETRGVSEMGITNTPFASKVFNLVDQLLFAIKADSVADMAIEEIKNGRKPVIAFKSTMESFLQSIDAKPGETLGKADFSLNLKRGLDGVFRYTITNERGEKIKMNLSLSEISPEGREEYQRIMNNIITASTGISISPIDQIHYKLQKAGLTSAEITGRSLMLQMNDDGSATVVNRTETKVNDIVRRFQHGKLDVIMINASGSTGLSLHDSMDPKQSTDGRQRVMLTTQLELDINKEIQKRGRIDRVGQKLRGAFRYIVSSIPAESRLLMMFKAKVRSLDANTTSSQKSKTTELDFPDFLNKHGDAVVTQYLADNPDINDLMGDPLKLKNDNGELKDDAGEEPVDGAARKVTGRVAILDSGNQEKFYNEVAQRYGDYINFLESNNANDLEVKVMPLNAKTISKSTLIVGKGGSTPFGTDSFLEKVEIDNLKKPLTSKELQEEVKTALGGKSADQVARDLITDHMTYDEDRMDRAKDAIKEKYERRRLEIPDRVVKKARKEKISDPAAIAQMVAQMEEDNQTAYNSELGRFISKEDAIYNNIQRRFNFFKIGEIYQVPTDIRVETNTGFSKAVFLGFTVRDNAKNKYAPSNITMRFATADSRRTIIVPLSKTAFLDSSIGQSWNMSEGMKQSVRDNWDKMESRKDRATRYIVSGNLLQGFGAAGNGQLVSYTTDSGELRKGILLNDDYKAEGQKIRVPITRLKDHIAGLTRYDSVTTTDQQVSIRKENVGYSIEVPASRTAGGKYYLDPELRSHVSGNNFRTSNGKMIAQFSDSKLGDVLGVLATKFGASVDVDKDVLPQSVLEGDVNKNAVDSILAKLDALKIKPGNELYAMAGIPITIWNGAIGIVKAVVSAGGSVYAGIKQAYQYLKDNHPDPIDEKAFSTEIRSELVATGVTHGEMAPETMNLANKALKAIQKGAKIADEVSKLQKFYNGLKPLLNAADGKLLDEELKMFSDYLDANAVEIPDGASRSQGEAYQKAKDLAEDIEKNNLNYQPATNFQKTLNKTASGIDKALSNKTLNKVLNLPNYIQDRTVGWLKSKAGERFRIAAEKMLESKAGIVRNIGSAMNGLFANIGKSVTDVNKAETFKGESAQRALSDALKISENLRKLIDNNKQSMLNIDQVLDPENYEYLRNMSRDDFALAIKAEEPDLTDAEIDSEYAEMRTAGGFDDPNYVPKTYDDLTPEEKSAHDIIRQVYDFIHETNFALGLLPKEKYWRNYGKYFARAYEPYEMPEEVQKAIAKSSSKLDLEGFMKREALTGWKALHKLGDPIYPMAKRLQQTLQNKALVDYANYLIQNKPDVVAKYEKPGYTKLGYGYGPLSQKWVRNDVVEDYRGYYYTSHSMQQFYEFLKAYDRLPVRQLYKRFFTVYNPTVHLGNILTNSFFGWVAGISPLRLNANLPYAIDQLTRYGEEYRMLLSEGVINTNIARGDLVSATKEVFGKEPPPGVPPPTTNAIVPARWVKTFFGTVARAMERFYAATDNVYKMAGYRSLIQLGYSHDQAVEKIKQGFQNYNRVGKTYDIASKLPVVGNAFGKFAGDLARITGEAITTRPLQTMAVLAGLHSLGIMLSQMAGETDEQRRRRANRPGATSIPMPHWFPEWLGGGREGGISLSFKNPYTKNTEINIAKYLSPIFTYNSYDGDDAGTFFNKFSPLPLEKGDRYSFAPNGSYPVIARNANDPVLAPIVQVLSNSDFRGVPILDPAENTYKKSTLTDRERMENAIRFLARAYTPHGGYAFDFYAAMQGKPDAYGRSLTKEQVFARFLGYKTLNFGPEKYDEVFNKRLKYWGNVFFEESKPISDLQNKYRSGQVDPATYQKRYTELVETQAEIVSEANKDMEKMTGNPNYFSSGRDLKAARSQTMKKIHRRKKDDE